jgi:hypothetical protein
MRLFLKDFEGLAIHAVERVEQAIAVATGALASAQLLQIK